MDPRKRKPDYMGVRVAPSREDKEPFFLWILSSIGGISLDNRGLGVVVGSLTGNKIEINVETKRHGDYQKITYSGRRKGQNYEGFYRIGDRKEPDGVFCLEPFPKSSHFLEAIVERMHDKAMQEQKASLV